MDIIYKCHWPNCEYKTENRNEIEYHHIVPKELWPRLNQNVVLSFCPTHHRLIYHPECKFGHHSIKGLNKLQIIHIYPTSDGGFAIEYKNSRDETFFYFFHDDYREPKETLDKYKI